MPNAYSQSLVDIRWGRQDWCRRARDLRRNRKKLKLILEVHLCVRRPMIADAGTKIPQMLAILDFYRSFTI